MRFSLIEILPEPGFDLGSTAGESCVLTARLHMLYSIPVSLNSRRSYKVHPCVWSELLNTVLILFSCL